jgi:hypothetical protein
VREDIERAIERLGIANACNEGYGDAYAELQELIEELEFLIKIAYSALIGICNTVSAMNLEEPIQMDGDGDCNSSIQAARNAIQLLNKVAVN